MVGCDESIAQTSQSHGSYMKECPFAGNQLGTDGICPAVVDCDLMPQEVCYEDDGSPSDNNDTDDERMAPFKDESEENWRTSYSCCERTDKHDMMIDISQYSMWSANSSLNIPIGAACHMQSLVF